LFCIVSVALVLLSCKTEPNTGEGESFKPPVSYEVAYQWADSIVSLMTTEEKLSFIGGDRIFFTQAVPRLGISPVMFADATQGIHLRDNWRGGEIKYKKVLGKSTAFPCPILLASTWNKEIAQRYAKAIGEECRAAGIPVLLGPGMNIYRISQCGRNFEYFGEDPFLAGEMIRNYVVGLQNTGTIATLKHFVANNTDYFRRKSNSVVDERTLHEIYTKAFKAGIDAGAMAVMTSYNLVNGEWCGQSEYVINDLLRGQLGFKWLVMTDWWSVYDGVKTIKSGQDLEMPYRVATADAKDLLEQGLIRVEEIDRMVRSILCTFYAMNVFDRVQEDEFLSTFEEHEEIALQTAREGIVLLRNANDILPLLDTTKKVLLTGDYMDRVAGGGGAATVKGYNHIVLRDALKGLYGENLIVNKEPSDEEIAGSDAVVLNIGTFDSEGSDRPFDLPETLDREIVRMAELNSNTIVVVNSGSGINMSRWNEKVAAILYAWYPGQNGAQAVAEIITGKVNPSGKLPVTIERDFKDSPGYGYIPEG
jgi:beta-glucosidase